MSDPEAPAPARGGPIWSQGAGASGPGPGPAPAPPSGLPPTTPVAAAEPPNRFLGATDPTGRQDELYQPKYARSSGSPVWYMLGAFALMGAAWWGLRWSTVTPEATDPVRSSEWWTNINAVLLPAENIHFAIYSEQRMWISLALTVLAAVSICLWIGRIGMNLRPGEQPFGSFLPALALPAWFMLPFSLALTSSSSPSRGDLLIRSLVAFGIVVVQFLLLRWTLLNRIWRAGHMRYDQTSIVLWLPMMIPWLMFFGSTSLSLVQAGEDGNLADAWWRPTDAMVDWAQALTRVSMVGILILLVVVSVIQHIGLVRDRAAFAASQERSRSDRLPLLRPGA